MFPVTCLCSLCSSTYWDCIVINLIYICNNVWLSWQTLNFIYFYFTSEFISSSQLFSLLLLHLYKPECKKTYKYTKYIWTNYTSTCSAPFRFDGGETVASSYRNKRLEVSSHFTASSSVDSNISPASHLSSHHPLLHFSILPIPDLLLIAPALSVSLSARRGKGLAKVISANSICALLSHSL